MGHVENLDRKVADGFGDEWARFDQTGLNDRELAQLFDNYFAIFPWDRLPANAVGADIGCGSGRWAKLVAPRVGTLHCVDPSSAVNVARRNLAEHPNCVFHTATADDLPFEDGSLDFAYALGVLHHIPDAGGALKSCVAKLKPGAPFLVYLYYNFDNRPGWYRALWKASDLLRRVISRLPHGLRFAVTQVIAALVYWPLARSARVAERTFGIDVRNWPLATAYKDQSFYCMRTDALDRFGTRLEHRFSRGEINAMMLAAGLGDIRFSENMPCWRAVGIKI